MRANLLSCISHSERPPFDSPKRLTLADDKPVPGTLLLDLFDRVALVARQHESQVFVFQVHRIGTGIRTWSKDSQAKGNDF
jgi:hypothetical protein